jgi:hypothetical protein
MGINEDVLVKAQILISNNSIYSIVNHMRNIEAGLTLFM